MNITESELQAYVDGELAPEDAARVEAACAADPDLAARLALAQRLRERVRDAFDGVIDEPVPDRLAALLRNAAGERASAPDGVVPFARREAGAAAAAGPVPRAPEADAVDTHALGARPVDAGRAGSIASNAAPPAPHGARRRPRAGWPAYALAASLAALAVSLWLRPAPGPVVVDDGTLVARGTLARGLDTVLASAPAEPGGVAVGLSFRDADGRVCRSFVQRDAGGIAGLACRDGDRWTLPVVSAADGVGGGELRQASSVVPPEVQAAIDARLQGDVFDAAQERAARDAGWR